jgi:endoplasmic reticulum junction formation protein lunapark
LLIAFAFLICSIFLLKNVVAWYFQRKVNSNSEELAELRAEKRQLLDQVKTKETYKDAVEILQRFGGNDRSFSNSPFSSTPIRPGGNSSPAPNAKMMVNTSTNMTPSMTAFKTPAARQLVNVNANISNLQQRMNSQTPSMMPLPPSAAAIRSMKRTPYPLIDNAQKSVMDKMVDYLIGDGPANRFAMICQQCYKHNGEWHFEIYFLEILFLKISLSRRNGTSRRL